MSKLVNFSSLFVVEKFHAQSGCGVLNFAVHSALISAPYLAVIEALPRPVLHLTKIPSIS